MFTLYPLGAVVSITIALLFPNEPDVPGVGRINTASLLLLSFIVPPFNNNEFIPVYSRSLLLCPASTIYTNVNIVLPEPLV